MTLTLTAGAAQRLAPDMDSRWLTGPDAVWLADPALGPDQAFEALLALDARDGVPGFSSQAVWLRFDISVTGPAWPRHYTLTNENPLIAELDAYLYAPDGRPLDHLALGLNQADLGARPVVERFQGKLTLAGGRDYDLLVRLRSGTPLALALRVTPEAGLAAFNRDRQASDWTMPAVLFTMAIFSAVLLFGWRDATQAWLLGFHAVLLVYFGALDGYGYLFLPAPWVAWLSSHILALNFLILILLYRFALAFLGQGRPLPPATPWYRFGLPLMQAAGGLLALLWVDRYVLPVFLVVQVLTILPILLYALRQWRDGYPPAMLLLLALVVQVIGGGIGTAAYIGVWPVSELALKAFFISGLLQLLLMTFAVGARMRLLEQRQRWLLLQDSATGLPGRGYIEQLLERDWPARRRAMREPLVLMIQLEGYRPVLQLMGPGVVQQLGVRALRDWNACLAGLPGVARLAGAGLDAYLAVWVRDIAVALVDGAELPDLESRLAHRRQLTLTVEDQTLELESRLACYRAGTGTEPFDEIMRRLTVALASARQQDRYWQYYSLEQDTFFQRRNRLTRALRGAIAAGELACHIQPVLDLESGRIAGGEILLRWHSAEFGDVSPAEFIPLAERTHWIRQLTGFVLSEVHRWREEVAGDRPVSVNLSVLDLIAEGEADPVARLMASAPKPAGVMLEITETLLMRDPDRCLETLTALRERGFRVSIDDFGTGYSSLAYLSRIRPDEIKIDRDFIRDLRRTSLNREIVEAIVRLARSMGAQVVAEGVEDAETLALCRSLGCHLAQGFHIARPMPLSDFDAWLARQARLRVDQ